MDGTPETGWLLLIHQMPPKPSYLRVKVWRRLQGLGAVAIKNSVYALPASAETREDFQWLQREIAELGGEATICEARFVDGLDDDQVRRLFNAQRDADYARLADDAKKALAALPPRGRPAADGAADAEAQLRRMERRFDQVVAIDFFGARGRAEAEAAVGAVRERIRPAAEPAPTNESNVAAFRNLTWVTREKIWIDRIACAWLIRRFVDAKARFRFVAGREHQPKKGEIRFDMFDAEFTHDGDRCSFEVMVRRFCPTDDALRQIAEIVHDLDLKDAKFGRAETTGLGMVIAGLAADGVEDAERLERGTLLFDALYRAFGAEAA